MVFHLVVLLRCVSAAKWKEKMWFPARFRNITNLVEGTSQLSFLNTFFSLMYFILLGVLLPLSLNKFWHFMAEMK